MKIPRWDKCHWCGGPGLVHGYMGDPEECRECGGSGVEEARDEKGRFLPWEEVPDELPATPEP